MQPIRYLKCSFTNKFMEDPVITCCGHTFERWYLEDLLSVHPHCPIDGTPLTSEDIRPNYLYFRLLALIFNNKCVSKVPCCLITGEPLSEFVVGLCGHTFDRKSLTKDDATCPIHKTNIHEKDLFYKRDVFYNRIAYQYLGIKAPDF